MLIWYCFNNPDIYYCVGKLPEQHFSVWLFSNPGDKTIFLLEFNEARISEWHVNDLTLNSLRTICDSTLLVAKVLQSVGNRTFAGLPSDIVILQLFWVKYMLLNDLKEEYSRMFGNISMNILESLSI